MVSNLEGNLKITFHVLKKIEVVRMIHGIDALPAYFCKNNTTI